nr:hypothetical protein [Tanacetum cinerariifolium]
MNYLQEQIDGEAMINSIKNGDQPLACVTQVSIAGTSSTEQPPLKDKSILSDQEKRFKRLIVLQDLFSFKDFRMISILSLIETKPQKTYGMLLLDICLVLNIEKKIGELQFCIRDVNDAMGLKKKTIVVTSDPLALIVEKIKASKRKEKVVVFLDSKGSDADDFSELKKITALLAKVLMIELMMHTEKNDTVFHTEKTRMLRLVVEIDVGGMTTDVVDKVTCSFDDLQLEQVDMKCVHA